MSATTHESAAWLMCEAFEQRSAQELLSAGHECVSQAGTQAQDLCVSKTSVCTLWVSKINLNTYTVLGT